MKIKVGPGIWLLIGALVCLVIFVLGLFVIVFPQKTKASDIDKQITETEQSIGLEGNRLSQLKQYEKDPDQFNRQIDALKEKIPETVELADIIQLLDHAAEESGLDFFSFKPSTPVSSSGIYVVTSEVSLQGRYFNLIEFLNQIERLPRTIKVVSLEIAPSDDSLPYLEIVLTLRAYFTTDLGIEKLAGSGS
ncbi:MAG: hypothetical protein A2Y75_05520 [Candidatus Solincola sediminis]|uniref:Pilus assembly protein PilO n=1 Tax=Candidatus Solincola sediminis TaxID=1797199 RepID=A0A1F2WFL8_9ACTN|nr:MAG: hypothetical protein A2Y75_05520 [Candidatus Solincola sediminis]